MDGAAPSSLVTLRASSAVTALPHALRAIDLLCDQCQSGLGGATPDLVSFFFSSHHMDAAKAFTYVIKRRLKPRCLIGASVDTVIGGDQELEGKPGISMFAATLPGVGIHPFRLDQLPQIKPGDEALRTGLAAATGMLTGRYRGTILLADPFSVAMNTLLPALAAARPTGAADEGRGLPPIVGGMASGSQRPNGNALILDDTILDAGALGVSLSGAVRMDALVSQGCRPFGSVFVITAAKGQMIKSLSGRPALRALHEAIETLDERGKSLLQRGLFLGRAVNEYKERFGRGDFLVRNVVGADQESGMLAIADMVRVGQTVQFHLRDAATASEDLGLLLDREQLYSPPIGVLLFTCNGRGQRLFGRPNHDAAAFSRAFAREEGGEEKAKPGQKIVPEGSAAPASSGGGSVPLAGFFAAGEIGPIGDGVFLHGHTASAAILREVNESRSHGATKPTSK